MRKETNKRIPRTYKFPALLVAALKKAQADKRRTATSIIEESVETWLKENAK